MHALSRVFTPLLQCLPKTRTRLLLGHRLLLPPMRSGRLDYVVASRPRLRITLPASTGLFGHAVSLSPFSAFHLERIHSLCAKGDHVYGSTRSRMFSGFERGHRKRLPTFLSTPPAMTSSEPVISRVMSDSSSVAAAACCASSLSNVGCRLEEFFRPSSILRPKREADRVLFLGPVSLSCRLPTCSSKVVSLSHAVLLFRNSPG